MKKKFYGFVLLSTATLSSFAAEIPEVSDYLKDLQLYESGKSKVSLETVYEKGLKAAKVLETKIESMDEKTFGKFQKDAKGLILNREESISVSPEVNFFLSLAKKSSSKADLAFFENLKSTYSQGMAIQDYYQLVTDVTACVDFEGSALVDSYGKWNSYRIQYPDLYKKSVTTEIESAEKAIMSDCVCGPKESYLSKLETIKKQFPSLVNKLKIQEKKTIRFSCSPT